MAGQTHIYPGSDDSGRAAIFLKRFTGGMPLNGFRSFSASVMPKMKPRRLKTECFLENP
jgi:hypothetical protein